MPTGPAVHRGGGYVGQVDARDAKPVFRTATGIAERIADKAFDSGCASMILDEARHGDCVGPIEGKRLRREIVFGKQ